MKKNMIMSMSLKITLLWKVSTLTIGAKPSSLRSRLEINTWKWNHNHTWRKDCHKHHLPTFPFSTKTKNASSFTGMMCSLFWCHKALEVGLHEQKISGVWHKRQRKSWGHRWFIQCGYHVVSSKQNHILVAARYPVGLESDSSNRVSWKACIRLQLGANTMLYLV